jgi:aryl-alcohol dehydrogenase-like predicted oxidoreductase
LKVDKRRLGRSGLEVSAIGLGCNNFGMKLDVEGARSVIDAAIDAGVTLFDTADIYGGGQSETFMGEVLGARRKDIVLATKFGFGVGGAPPRGDRRHIFNAVESSLRKLKTDWIDLYQVHAFDPATPIDETLRALDDLVRQGKVRYIGCSNFKAWQVVEADWIATTEGLHRFISCQDEYSLVHRGIELDLLPAMQAKGLGLLPYFPLAGGLLTGKYRGGDTPADGRLNNPRFSKLLNDENTALVEALNAFAEQRGHTLLELAFSWLLAQPGLGSVIAGATSPAQVCANVAAAAWRLTPQELAELGVLLGPPKPGGVLH